jgi:NADPH2:quinone reductase
MRALVIDSFGGPEALHWAEIPKPEPGPGQALVHVQYAGANPADWKAREGMLSRFFDCHFPFILGFDLAGVVEAVGPGVALNPGDRVFGTSRQGEGQNGSYAEYTTAYGAMLAHVPEGMALAEAAAMPTAGMTAYGGLVDVGKLGSGQTVLINGGTGGVGSIGVQIARAFGARVAVTCGPANADYAKRLGADLVIDYRVSDIPATVRRWAPDGVDLLLDAVGLDTVLPRAAALVKRGGTFVEIQTLMSAASQTQVSEATRTGVSIVSNMVAVARLPQHLSGLARLMSEGKVRMPVLEVMPLGEAACAHKRLADGHTRGKIVLEVNA